MLKRMRKIDNGCSAIYFNFDIDIFSHTDKRDNETEKRNKKVKKTR